MRYINVSWFSSITFWLFPNLTRCISSTKSRNFWSMRKIGPITWKNKVTSSITSCALKSLQETCLNQTKTYMHTYETFMQQQYITAYPPHLASFLFKLRGRVLNCLILSYLIVTSIMPRTGQSCIGYVLSILSPRTISWTVLLCVETTQSSVSHHISVMLLHLID